MIVKHGDRFLGVLGLMDTPRPAARDAVAALQGVGIRRAIMLSGDHQLVAESIAREVGLTDAWGDLMPEDKVAAIERLRTEEGKVAMVGDGVNDAPALAHATVGIAMGAAGSDVALETADIALMGDDLAKLPVVIGLSRKASGIIRQNLYLSLGMVAFLIPATIVGFVGIGPAVVFHEGSTLVVVANALRLLAYRGSATQSTAHNIEETPHDRQLHRHTALPEVPGRDAHLRTQRRHHRPMPGMPRHLPRPRRARTSHRRRRATRRRSNTAANGRRR